VETVIRIDDDYALTPARGSSEWIAADSSCTRGARPYTAGEYIGRDLVHGHSGNVRQPLVGVQTEFQFDVRSPYEVSGSRILGQAGDQRGRVHFHGLAGRQWPEHIDLAG
jgi:hypothetical protein